MKKSVLIIGILSFVFNSLLFTVHCFAQDWQWVNPYPQGNTLNSVFFTDSTHGWAVGDYGTVIKYENGKWNLIPKMTTQNLNSVSFLDSSNGYIVGDSGLIFHYDGAKWIAQKSPTTSNLNSVFCFDANNIWVAGGNTLYDNSGVILKYDGNQWIIQQSFPDYSLNSICIINKKLGWVVGGEAYYYNFGIILRYDGKIWTKELDTNSIYDALDLKSISFIDSTHVWAAGSQWLLKFDGKQWFFQDSGSYNSVCMLDTNTGWAVGSPFYAPFFFSPTPISKFNGKNWINYNYENDGIDSLAGLNSVYFTDKNHGWAVGWNGTILNYNGIKWTRQSVDSIDMSTFYFTKPNHGWAIGVTQANPNPGLLKYDNGKWSFNSLILGWKGYILDSNHVWSLGSSCIYKYNGKNLIEQNIPPMCGALLSIYMADTTHGWVGCGNGILKYDGKQWNLDISTTDQVFAIFGTDKNNVWADNKNYNGKTWDTNYFHLFAYSIYFVDKNHGWVVGELGDISKYNGKEWTLENSGTSNDLYSVFFTDTMHGWAVGENGTILKYNGKYWLPQSSLTNNSNFSVVYFSDSLNGWISGTCNSQWSTGTILHTTSGGGIWTEVNKPAQKSKFEVQVYPNPITDLSVLTYQLPSKTSVNIKIYDFTGREVLTLMNGTQDKGAYKINLYPNNFRDGMYFIKIETNNNISTLKFIKD